MLTYRSPNSSIQRESVRPAATQIWSIMKYTACLYCVDLWLHHVTFENDMSYSDLGPWLKKYGFRIACHCFVYTVSDFLVYYQ